MHHSDPATSPRKPDSLFRIKSDGRFVYVSSTTDDPAANYSAWKRSLLLFIGNTAPVPITDVVAGQGRWMESSAARLFSGLAPAHRGSIRLPEEAPSISNGGPTLSYHGREEGRHEELERLRIEDFDISESATSVTITPVRAGPSQTEARSTEPTPPAVASEDLATLARRIAKVRWVLRSALLIERTLSELVAARQPRDGSEAPDHEATNPGSITFEFAAFLAGYDPDRLRWDGPGWTRSADLWARIDDGVLVVAREAIEWVWAQASE